jgi:lipopolysaccharide/colanic/teichoic acid biosynthesis glycosyltransferase
MKEKLNILFVGRSDETIGLLKNHSKVALRIADNMLQAENILTPDCDIDAIVCEYQIPGGDGMMLNNLVRGQDRFNSVPFILASELFEKSLIKRSFMQLIDDFYVMPMPPAQDLVDRILFLKNHRKKEKSISGEEAQVQTMKTPPTKRLFDIIVSGTALVLVSPVLLLIGLAIRMESKGQIYYVSKRVGKKPFDFYKLRSMRSGSDAELAKLAKEKNQYTTSTGQARIDFSRPCPRCSELSEGRSCSPILHLGHESICDYWYNAQKKEVEKSKSSFIKIVDDPRVTRVGKFIRNTSIDELPQLINVLKGDMSIVGNRPLPVYEAERLTQDQIAKRFLAPAGITGLWQVELRGKGGNMSEEERIRLDNVYADHFVDNNYSFWYDLKLILRTLPALFQKAAV